MADWWMEEWSFGAEGARTYCWITRHPDGYSVDVFRGNTCVDSFVYGTLAEAKTVARGLKTQYRKQLMPFS